MVYNDNVESCEVKLMAFCFSKFKSGRMIIIYIYENHLGGFYAITLASDKHVQR
jgi:hypothetical protein